MRKTWKGLWTIQQKRWENLSKWPGAPCPVCLRYQRTEFKEGKEFSPSRSLKEGGHTGTGQQVSQETWRKSTCACACDMWQGRACLCLCLYHSSSSVLGYSLWGERPSLDSGWGMGQELCSRRRQPSLLKIFWPRPCGHSPTANQGY